ncbi:MAG: hypothetical protein K5829_13145 [Treponema sp.]|nr:hypothetical protein [Treponema sp.]
MKKLINIMSIALLSCAVLFTSCDFGGMESTVKTGKKLAWSIYPDSNKDEENETITNAWKDGKIIKVDATVKMGGVFRLQDQWWQDTGSCKAYKDQACTQEVTFDSEGYDGTLYFNPAERKSDLNASDLPCFGGNDAVLWLDSIEAVDNISVDERLETLENLVLPGEAITYDDNDKYTFDFSKMTLANGGYGDVPTINSDKYLEVKGAGNWQQANLSLEKKLDLSSASKFVITLKVADDYADTTGNEYGGLKLGAVDSIGGTIDINVSAKVSHTLPKDFTDIELPISEFYTAGSFDWEKVTKLTLMPQGDTGTITVKSIVLVSN